MDKPLTLQDIDEKFRSRVYTQDYSPKQLIDGVNVIQLKHVVGEEGDFSELLRLNEKGEFLQIPGFSVRQINRSTQLPNSIKAWHVHMRQDELWYVPEESHLLVGLWDLRKGSPTRGMTNRMVLGRSTHRLLYIPRGVAHGSANVSTSMGVIIYFVNSHFNKENPDEHRIPWDTLGATFWMPSRD